MLLLSRRARHAKKITHKHTHTHPPQVPAITESIKSFLASHPAINTALPHGASLKGLTPWSLTLGVTAHTTGAAARRFSAVNSEIVAAVTRAVTAAGAGLAKPP